MNIHDFDPKRDDREYPLYDDGEPVIFWIDLACKVAVPLVVCFTLILLTAHLFAWAVR